MCRCRTTQPHFLAEQRLAAATAAAAATTALSFAFLESVGEKLTSIIGLELSESYFIRFAYQLRLRFLFIKSKREQCK